MSKVPPEAPAPAMLAAAAGPVPVPAARIRREMSIPLRFVDGYVTTARVFSFDGLADGREHLALGLGDWQASLGRHTSTGNGRTGTGSGHSGAGNGHSGTGNGHSGSRNGNGQGSHGQSGNGSRPVPLVRPHSECLTGDVLGSQRCDCGPQLRESVERIAQVGGFLLYLRQEGRGIGLYAKLDAYALQDAGMDTYEANVALGHGADERDYTVAAQMLHALGVDRVALLSNNPDKATQLSQMGVEVTKLISTGVHLSEANLRYLMTKVSRAAHTLDLP